MFEKPFHLKANFTPAGDQPGAIAALIQGLQDNLSSQILLGVTGSGKTYTIAEVIESVQRPTLIMAPNKTLAAQLYGEFKTFFPDNAVEYFVSYYDYYQPEAYVPASDLFIEKDASINEQIEQMRLSATKTMIERSDALVVATVSAIYGLGDPTLYLKMIVSLAVGEILDQRTLLKRLAELQYKRTSLVLERGMFRVHGDVVDIFPADEERNAIRVALFGDEIESIATFDPLTGEIIKKHARITIFPKSHYVTPRERILETIEWVKIELAERLEYFRSQNKLLEAQRLEERTRFDIEMMLELGYCSGIENYSRYLSGRKAGEPPPTLFDYLPKQSLLIIDESHVTIPQIGGMYRGDRARKENLVQYGFRLPSALDNRPLQFEEFLERSPQTIYVSATPGPYEMGHNQKIAEQVVRPTGLIDPEIEVRPATTQIDDLLSEIKKRVSVEERVLVTTLTKRMSENLTEYLAEHGVKVRYLHSDIETLERVEIISDLRRGVFDVLVGINLLREGLDMPEVSLVAILDADKEGFLRSSRALIQTIGRAARHIHGKALLYADNITGSMAFAMEETERRRVKQKHYNEQHGITPMGIQKNIHDILESDWGTSNQRVMHAAHQQALYADLAPHALNKKIKTLEKAMYTAAENLEFEEAAHLRDEIHHIRESLKGM